MSSRVIDAVFRLRDEFTKPMKNCVTALTDVQREGKNARREIEKVGTQISSIGKSMTAAFTVPLAAGATAAVKYAGDVSKSMSLAKATIGITAETMEDWERAQEAMEDAAADHIFSMEDASDAMLNFARQGYSAIDIANLMSGTMDYAQGTAADLADTASGIGNILKSFSQEATIENVTAHFDEMVRAQAAANTNGQELIEGIQRMGPAMHRVGYDVSDAATLIAAWGDAGIGAAEAANAWKTASARMASPKTAKAFRDRFDWSMYDENGMAKDLVTVQRELHEIFSGLNEEEQTRWADSLFGKNQMDKMLAIVYQAPERFAALHEEISGGAQSAKELSDAMMDSLGGSIEGLLSSLDVLKYQIGELLGSYVQPMIKQVTSWVDALRKLDDEQKIQIGKILGIIAAVGPALILFGKAVTLGAKLAGVIASVNAAGGVIPAVLAAITSPAAIVIGIIAALVAAGVLIYKNWDTIKEKAGELHDVLTEKWNALKEFMAPSLEAAKEAFEGIKATLAETSEAIQPKLEAFSESFAELREAISPLIEGAGEKLAEFGSALAELLWGSDRQSENATAIKQVGEAISTAIGAAGTAIEGTLDTLKSLNEFLTGLFTADWKAAWEEISSVFQPIADSITSAIDGIKSALEGASGKFSEFKQKASEKWDQSALNWNNWGFSTPAGNAAGTNYWRGGPTRVGESGGEIINLPSGTQIIPHDASRNTQIGQGITVAKLADTIVVREQADIDRITDALVRKLMDAEANMGTVQPA